MRNYLAMFFLMSVCANYLFATEDVGRAKTFLSGQLVLGTPMATPFAEPSPIMGFEFALIPWDDLGFDISYFHISRRYYRFDHSTGQWIGPSIWGENFVGNPQTWPFYEERSLVTVGPRLRFDQGVFEFFVSPAIAFNILSQPDSTEFYPEFRAIVTDERTKSSGTGFALKVGAQSTFFLLGLGIEYQFDSTAVYNPKIDNSEDFFRYLMKSSNLLLTLGIKI